MSVPKRLQIRNYQLRHQLEVIRSEIQLSPSLVLNTSNRGPILNKLEELIGLFYADLPKSDRTEV